MLLITTTKIVASVLACFSLARASLPQAQYHVVGPGLSSQLPEAPDSPPWSPAVSSLRSLSSQDFTTLKHPALPEYNVRIKKADGWCDTTVGVYTGYIDFQARHLFFYFFESRTDPDNDPLMMWINGGPGASSSIGLLMELGPCSVDPNSVNQTIWNPYSWNNNSNIFFLDEPVGVGFSYADYGISVSTTEQAAKDIVSFLRLFLEHFTQFKGRDFHLAGESYGGRYIPVFASEIVDWNARAVGAGQDPINLKSVLIGNGWTNWALQLDSYIDLQCTAASVPPIQSIAACVRMRSTIARCKAMIKAECQDRFDFISCRTASIFCNQETLTPFTTLGLNVYDISKQCEGEPDDLCYPIIGKITQHLNLPSIRQVLGVDPRVKTFNSASMDVAEAFAIAGDDLHDTSLYVAALLGRGVKVLIYAGDYDLICNWLGNLKWTEEFEWTGHAAFVSHPLTPWYVDGEKAGITRSSNGLVFATVHGAGHMVPYDKPVQALAMLKSWLASYSIE